MKNLILILLVVLLNISLKSQQLVANAGEDQYFCYMSDVMSIVLTANVSGGQPPYTYFWSSNSEEVIISDNPGLPDNQVQVANYEVNYSTYLKVTDSIGNIAYDTVNITNLPAPITFTTYPYNLPVEHYISQGDSVWIETDTIVSIVDNATCLWSTSTGLEYNICSGFWVKPSITTSYFLTVTDEVGCSGQGGTNIALHKVHVDDVGINSYTKNSINIYPNPAHEILNFNNETNYEITDLQGKILLKSEQTAKYVNISNLKSGIYIIKVGNIVHKFTKE